MEDTVEKKTTKARSRAWYAGYFLYAAAVWGLTAYVDPVSPEVARLLAWTGCACVISSIVAFGGRAYWRARGVRPFEEYLTVATFRTGFATVCVLFALRYCPEELRRACACRILSAYWVTFPFHVWLTTPPKEDCASSDVKSDELVR